MRGDSLGEGVRGGTCKGREERKVDLWKKGTTRSVSKGELEVRNEVLRGRLRMVTSLKSL